MTYTLYNRYHKTPLNGAKREGDVPLKCNFFDQYFTKHIFKKYFQTPGTTRNNFYKMPRSSQINFEARKNIGQKCVKTTLKRS